jgi:hypothetical protein
VKLSEMTRGMCAGHQLGSKKGAGRVGGRRGREIRRCARVRTRRSTASAEGAELTGQAHGVKREERGARDNCSTTGDPGPRDRERGSERGRKLAPTGWPHWATSEGGRARARENCCWQAGSACQTAQAPRRVAWLGRLGPAGLLSLFLFL